MGLREKKAAAHQNEEKERNSRLERVACLVTNRFVPPPSTSQGGYWTTGNGIPVHNVPPLDGNTLGTLHPSCLLMSLGSFGPFGTFLVWGQWEEFIDLFL